MNDIGDLKLFLTETFPGYSLTYNKKIDFLLLMFREKYFILIKFLKPKY